MCPGTSRQTHKPCRLGAGHGTDHVGFGFCKFHGGSTPNGAKHAAKIQAVAAAAGTEVEPHDALLHSLGQQHGIAEFFASKVAELADDQVVTKGELHHWIRFWEDANRARAQLAKVAIDAGVDERRIRLEEALVSQLANAIDGLLTALGVRDHPDAPAAVERAFRLIEGGKAA